MPCTEPLKAWVYGLTENGKPNYVFKRPTNNPDLEQQLLPCGACLSCQIDKAKEWATRGFHESQTHTENSFITLTYNNKSLPENGTLVREDLTNFIKRLRYYINVGRKKNDKDFIKTKYLASGEYGSEEYTHRPHYHICLFGYDPRDKEYLFTNEYGDPVYTSEFISKVWQNKGHVTVGELNYRTVAYVARYTVKKIVEKGQRTQTEYWIDKETGETNYDPIAYKKGLLMQGKIPEFITSSNGIGEEWYKKNKKETYKDYLTVNYAKHKVPRYYDKKLEETDPELLQAIKDKRAEAAKENKKSKTKLKSEATIKRGQINRLKRRL
jgi:hypothetical protein